MQLNEQTVIGALHGVHLVQLDSGGQKCATPPPFPSDEARAVNDVLFACIKEGQATIDPRRVLECAVLLDHGRLLVVPVSDLATCGVQQLCRFMASHRDELSAAHVHCERA